LTSTSGGKIRCEIIDRLQTMRDDDVKCIKLTKTGLEEVLVKYQ